MDATNRPLTLSKATIVGIQGGRGSFNEQAARLNLPGVMGETPYTLEYLHTSPAVFEALKNGQIEYGQFALCNSIGGPYNESLMALAQHVVAIRAVYPMPIRHAVIAAPGTSLSDISKIVSHEQVLKQCARSLARLLPEVGQEVGTGQLTDPASVAAAIADGRLPRSVATVSNPAMAEVHGLSILANDVQDDDNNRSWFVLVSAG
jgi:prephenate dehydratase